MVRRGASLDANQARWQLLEERQDGAALQLAADDHLAGGINSVDLKDRLGDVETDRRDRLHDWLLQIVGALTAPTSLALTCRAEEPSTASRTDIDRLFDHLVGDGEYGRRNGKADGLRGPEIDN